MKNPNLIRLAIKKGDKYLPEEYTWDYCIANKIPQILVDPKVKYATVSCDLMSIDFGLVFPDGKSFINEWEIYYNVYCDRHGIPDNKYSLIGGSINLGFTILKKDLITVVQSLIEQIDLHVKKYGIIDPVRKEYYEINTRLNKMRNTLEHSVPWDEEVYDKLEKQLRVLGEKMNF